MSKILICGGTGFVGSAIVRELSKTHNNLRVLTRNCSKIKNQIQGVEYVSGNLQDITSIQKAMQDCDTVINAAQFDNAPFENPRKGLTYEKVDAEGTENIVEAAKKSNLSRILYISGAGVDENKSEPWFQAKCSAEKVVKNSGMKWTIFRPSWIYGPGDRSLNRIIPMVRYSPIVFILGSGYKIQPIFIDEVASVVAKSVESPHTYGQVYELGGPEQLTMKQILQTVATVLNQRRIYVSIPKSMARILFSILEKIPGIPVTEAALDFITMNVVILPEAQNKVRNDFQFEFQPLKKSLQTYI